MRFPIGFVCCLFSNSPNGYQIECFKVFLSLMSFGETWNGLLPCCWLARFSAYPGRLRHGSTSIRAGLYRTPYAVYTLKATAEPLLKTTPSDLTVRFVKSRPMSLSGVFNQRDFT